MLVTSTLAEHHGYLSDARRIELYRAAIAKCVRPGDIVVDVGCGFGVLGLLCLQAGASRVYGIDSSRAIDIARETAVRAGFGDRYTCLRGRSFEIEVPEPADVLICDHVGYFGIDYGIVDVLVDAKARFLKQGGQIIPQALALSLAAVKADAMRSRLDAWREGTVPPMYGWLRGHTVNTKHAVDLTGGDLVSAGAVGARIDLSVPQPSLIPVSTTLIADSDGPVDGLAGWFDCSLVDDILMTNAPGDANAIGRHQIFLGFDTPLAVQKGDAIEVSVKVRHAESILAWTGHVARTGQRARQSNWASLLLGDRGHGGRNGQGL